jgi:signal transduction histidine kinase
VESELRRAHRLESAVELARGVAHDFRNMLGVVRGNAELLAEDLPDRRDWQRRVYRILESERHATELAEQLRLYAGGADPRLHPVDLSDLVRDVWDYLEAEGGSGLAASLVLDRSRLPVEADPTQIRRVAMNLFVNAREALGESGGTVRVETRHRWLDPATEPGVVSGREVPAGPFAGLRVVDDGPGMDAATQERLFDPFFSTRGKRRGVGLATVLGIARAHGGVLQLRTAPGRGTEITLHLPMDPDDVRDDPPPTRH